MHRNFTTLVALSLVLASPATLTASATGGVPDLVARNLTWTPTDPAHGDTMTFTARVANEGNASASNFTVRFLLDSGWHLGNVTVTNLTPGGSKNVTSAPWTATLGAHTITVQVDPANHVAESNESNNNLTKSFTVRAPDLLVEDIQVSPASPVEEDNVTFTATVHNAGTATAPASRLRFGVNSNIPIGDVDVPVLAPGARANVTSPAWFATYGTHTIRAKADVNNTVTESNESNNARDETFFVAPRPRANLTPLDVTWTPAAPRAGDAMTFTTTVANLGEAHAGNFTVRFLLDNVTLSEHLVPGLAVNATANVTSDAWSATEGGHSIRVAADVYDTVRESKETDNNRTETFSVGPPRLPDLVPLNLTWTPGSPRGGDATTFTATVRNDGEAAAGNFTVRFILDGTTTLSEHAIAGLPVGGSANVSSDAWTAVEGNHTVTFRVDATSTVAESNETNNDLTQNVGVAPAPRPDLVLVDVAWTPATPLAGESVTFTATVRNDGNATAVNATVRFTLDGNVALGSRTIASLAPGASANVTSDAWLATYGNHTINATADPEDAILEWNESNNARAETLFVEAIDLRVADIEIYPEVPEEPQNVTFLARVENVGTANATATVLEFRVDGVFLSNATVPALGPGEWAYVASEVWRSVRGAHNVTATVDPAGSVPESDETNNARAENFTVIPPRPDLTILRITASPERPRAGDAVNFTAIVENRGNGTAVNFTVRFTLDGTLPLGEPVVVTLAPGANASVVSNAWTSAEGNHTILAEADPANLVDEQIETNNNLTATLAVGPARRADLTLLNLTWTPVAPREGDVTRFRADVHNKGEIASGNFTLRFILDGAVLSDHAVGSLPVNATVTVESLAWTSTEGNHTITAVADVHDVVFEWDETNNNATRTFTVGPPRLADLLPANVTWSPASPIEGQWVNFTATVRNLGEANATAFVVRFIVNNATLGNVNVTGLAVGATINVTSPSWNATQGSGTVTVVVDALDEILESDEANNNLTRSFFVDGYGVDLSPNHQSKTVLPAGSTTYTITVTNTGTLSDTVNLAIMSVPSGWTASLSATSVTLAAGASTTVTLTVTAEIGTLGSATIPVRGTSANRSSEWEEVTTTTTVGS